MIYRRLNSSQGRRALPHATLLDIFSPPSSFALLYPLQTSKKHISQSTAQHGCPRAIRELQRVGAERGKCAYHTEHVLTSCAESVSSPHSPTPMRLSLSALQRISTGTRLPPATVIAILTRAKCLRSRTSRRHSHLPRHNRRNTHNRPPDRRQQARPACAHHNDGPRTATSAQLNTRRRQDTADRRAPLSPRQRNMLQRPCRSRAPGH